MQTINSFNFSVHHVLLLLQIKLSIQESGSSSVLVFYDFCVVDFKTKKVIKPSMNYPEKYPQDSALLDLDHNTLLHKMASCLQRPSQLLACDILVSFPARKMRSYYRKHSRFALLLFAC